MIRALEEILADTKNMVFFGGAGVSTESGIPDFRSVDGLYHQKFKYPPETMLSHSFYERHTDEFYDFYRQKLIVHGAKPNAAHLRLAALEREGKCKAVVTQNIDGLHQAAGSKVVYELHGSTLRNYCTRCGKFFPVNFKTMLCAAAFACKEASASPPPKPSCSGLTFSMPFFRLAAILTLSACIPLSIIKVPIDNLTSAFTCFKTANGIRISGTRALA